MDSREIGTYEVIYEELKEYLPDVIDDFIKDNYDFVDREDAFRYVLKQINIYGLKEE